jgi:rod shape-determining protein MreC
MRYLSRHKGVIVGLILLLVSSIFIVTNKADGTASARVRKVFLTVLSPVQMLFKSAANDMVLLWDHYIYLKDKSYENMELKRLLEKADSEYKSLETLYAEVENKNKRLEEILGFSEEVPFDFVPARVIGMDPSIYSDTIIIDKGEKDSITSDMPVVSVSGIVGIVLIVSEDSSRVMLINNKNCRVDVMVQDNRARGILEGSAGGVVRLSYVDKNEDVSPGDVVVTSGMDGFFPKGMPVGEVLDVKKPDYGIFQEIIVTPSAKLKNLEEVLIIVK